MKIILFDNWRTDPGLAWHGRNADKLNELGIELVRARDLRLQPTCVHLSYAPDCLKYIEASHDFALFYIGDPNKDSLPALSVWQAAGFWIGSRSRLSPLSERSDEKIDALIVCEGERISNFDNYRFVCDQKEQSRRKLDLCNLRNTDVPEWRTWITQFVFEHLVMPLENGHTPNPRQQKLRKLAEHLGVDQQWLRLSGYRQSPRACKFKPAALEVVRSYAEYSRLLQQLEQIIFYAGICNNTIHNAVSEQRRITGKVVAANLGIDSLIGPQNSPKLFSPLRQISLSLRELARLVGLTPLLVVERLLERSTRTLSAVSPSSTEALTRSSGVDPNMDWGSLLDLLDGLHTGASACSNEIQKKMLAMDLRGKVVDNDLCFAFGSVLKHGFSTYYEHAFVEPEKV